MQAGKLDRRITIQGYTNTVNAAGTPVMTWTDKATVWAELVKRSTREFLRAGGGAADERTAVFRIRWWPGVSTSDRVLFEGRAYDIREVGEIGRRVGLDLRCVEVTGDG